MKKLATLLVLAIAITLNAIAPTYAGAIGGSRYGDYTIRPFSTHSFQIAFRGGEYARVTVNGNRNTDLDLYIYDQWGRQVDFDDDGTDYCVAEWYVRDTAYFTVTIVNRGRYFNSYSISTN